MNHPAILLAMAVAALGLACHRPAAEPSPRSLPGLRPDQSCKPSGPIDVELLQVEDYGDGSVGIELKLVPLLEMQALEWQLQLEPGMQLLEGQGQGRLVLAKQQLSKRRMRVSLPSGMPSGFGRLSVEVSGVFAGSDEGAQRPERVVVRRTLSWGEPGSPGVERSYVDGARAEVLRLVELPSSAVAGAGAVYRAGR